MSEPDMEGKSDSDPDFLPSRDDGIWESDPDFSLC
jgi:hypothetical protein